MESSTDWKDEINRTARSLFQTLVGEAGVSPFNDLLGSTYDKFSRHPSPADDLLQLSYWACGGRDIQALAPLFLSWRTMRIAAKSFDDVEDEAGGAAQVNLATAFLFLSQRALMATAGGGSFSSERQIEIARGFSLAGLRACMGQHLDISGQSGQNKLDPDAWLDIASKKSGALFAWSAWAGARLAGAPQPLAERLHEYGFCLGKLIQVADDFNDFWGPGGLRTPFAVRISLPYVYAVYVAGEVQRAWLEQRADRLFDSDENRQVFSKTLVDLGAQKYTLAAAWMISQQAQRAVRAAEIEDSAQRHLVDFITRYVSNAFPPLPTQNPR